jgi:hypothetical protein
MKLLEVSLFFASVVSPANTVTVIGYNAIKCEFLPHVSNKMPPCLKLPKLIVYL